MTPKAAAIRRAELLHPLHHALAGRRAHEVHRNTATPAGARRRRRGVLRATSSLMQSMNPDPVSFTPSRRRLATLAACLVLALAAGCGGGGGGGVTNAGDSSTGSGSSGGTGTGTGTGTGSGGTTTSPALPVATGSGVTVLVGSGGTLPSGATRVATLAAVGWSALPAGSLVLVAPGTYTGVTTITTVGTSANPVVVTAYDPTDPPVLTDSVDFQGAAWVQVSHVVVQAPTYAGFIIRLGSNHLTVSDSTVNLGTDGVNITDGAGTGHSILRNTFADSSIDGIYAEVDSDPTERTLIQHNSVVRSGVHGIELRASHYQVEYNTVSGSGQTSGGASGIHVYSGSASEGSGADNWVRYNSSYANLDTVAYDGNGIEIDQWCNGNTVAFNQVWGNDGDGILVYDGSNNVIQNNTAWSNGVDSGHIRAARDEIAITGTSAATVNGNHVWNNIGVATRAAVSALHIDDNAVAGGNLIGANLLANTAGGTVMFWTDSLTEQTAAQIDAVTGISGNVVATPSFANTADPLAGGLKLTALPALSGLIPTGLADLAGATPAVGDAFFGAYYTVP
jgi:parallel beta-helix repeat protein